MGRDLTGRVIAITGASSGIGAATAAACAEAGMDVAISARREDRLGETAARVEQLGRKAVVVPGDVDRDQDVRRLIDRTVSELGRLDAVFANAGYGLYGSIADATDDRAHAIFETNFFGTLRTVRAAAAVMRQRGEGHILICSSAVSEIGLPMYGLYCATKAAQDSIASAMRAELAHEGIYVSSVHPVGTRTDFYDTARDRSGTPEPQFNTPSSLVQSADKVAKAIVRCLRRPKPEVWPQPMVRIGMAIVTAVPAFNAMSMRGLMRKRYPHAGKPSAAP
jgi:short-subunit dehydrogenase